MSETRGNAQLAAMESDMSGCLDVIRRPTNVEPEEVFAEMATPPLANRHEVVRERSLVVLAASAAIATWVTLASIGPSGGTFLLLLAFGTYATGIALGAFASCLAARPACLLFTPRFLIEHRGDRVDCIAWDEVTRIELEITESGTPVAVNFYHHQDRCATFGDEYGDPEQLAKDATVHVAQSVTRRVKQRVARTPRARHLRLVV
jgi:hypothetical protein